MKIILKAFGYLQSDIMEVPENTTPEFKLVITQPLSVIHGYKGDNIGEIKPINTIAEFVFNGKWAVVNGVMGREYILKDIYKQ